MLDQIPATIEKRPGLVIAEESKQWLLNLCVNIPSTDLLDFIALTQEHWAENGIPEFNLHLDWKQYHAAVQYDRLTMVTMRDDGRLVGYFILVFASMQHYKDQIFAIQESHFIAKPYRTKSVGLISVPLLLFKAVEVVARRRGAKMIKVALRDMTNADFMRHIGYTFSEVVYRKPLEDIHA